MSLDHILLGLLKEPASGYDLKSVFDHRIRYYWAADQSQIYVTLKRLERQGFLESTREPSDKGPPRRVYHRTEAGTEVLHEWLRGPPKVGDERFAYAAQLALMGELDDLSRTRDYLLELENLLAQRLEMLDGIQRDTFGNADIDPLTLPPARFHAWLTLHLGRRMVRTRMHWCRDCAELVREREKVESEQLSAASGS